MGEGLVVMSREEILRRIRDEFIEMPGLCLTHAQAQRLWGLDAQTCASLMSSLTQDHFLSLRKDGSYGRPFGAAVMRNFPLRAAKNFH
jgi:hypothetical protein